MKDNGIVIRLLSEDSIEKQVLVFRSAFDSNSNIEDIINYWRKKHYTNPIESSLIFGAFDGEELVGLNAYIPTCYRFNGEDVYVLQSCESGVLPSHQGKGIWGKIVRYAVEYIVKKTRYVAVIGFPNFRNSYPGFKKMGWKTLFQMNNYILVNNAKSFSKGLFGNVILQFLAQASIVLRAPSFFFSVFRDNIIVRECEINEVVWCDVQNKITINHSQEWLNWKEDYKQLKSLAVFQDNEIVANCIYGIDHFEGNEVIRLDYFSCIDNNINKEVVFLSRILKYWKKEFPKAAFIRSWTMPGSYQTKLFKKLWFLRSSHPNPFIITEADDNLSNKEWSLSFFDLD